MSLINVAGLTFGYDGSFENVFENASFQIDTDWKLGFVGRNGRGKTTLLRLLMGREEYRGSIAASVAFDYFPFPVEDMSQRTLTVLEGIAPAAEHWEITCETALLGLDYEALERPFSTLSHGERTKALLAALFLKPGRFLLIDEPTNHLDMEGRALVSRYLASKKGFILVSHDRVFLDGCVDHILSINRADIQVMAGSFSAWWENKQRQDQYELTENERLRKDVKRLQAAARRAAEWSDKSEASKIGSHAADRGFVGAQAARMMKASKNIESRRNVAVEDKSKLLKNLETSAPLAIHPLRYHQNVLLELAEVTLAYAEKPVCGPLSLTLTRGERVAIRGRNGSGKSSILKLLLAQTGAVPDAAEGLRYGGVLRLGSQLAVSHVSQDTSDLRGGLRDFCVSQGIDESLFKAILRKMDFSRTQLEKPMEDYSGGQKKKVLLAKSLSQQAHLYLWDEPLNFVDLLSRLQIEELLLAHRPTMLFVEHDRAFCDEIATKTLKI